MKHHMTFILAAAVAASLAGCALTSKADVVDVRYFTPAHVKPRLTSADAHAPAKVTTGAAAMPEVRLGRVSSGPHLRERIAYRDAAYEIGYYEDRRWTERPEAFVRREVARTLFEERGFRHVLGGPAPTLEIEVVSFDELRAEAGRHARVELRIVLFEDRAVLLEDTIVVDRPVASRGAGAAKGAKDDGRIEDFVAAMAEALDVAADAVATRLATVLAARAAASAPSP